MSSLRSRAARACLIITTAAALSAPRAGVAQQSSPDSAAAQHAYLLGAQVTVIAQHLAPFHAPYSGPNSLIATGDTRVSHTYGAYFGAALGSHLQAYVDAEMARGAGVGRALGLAAAVNGDVIRQGSADLGQGPYLARIFVRDVIPLGTSGARDTLAATPDQVPVVVAARRLELTAGKLAVSDQFDLNWYANSTRTQFLNWGLFQNTAWDYAADTRGYTNGAMAAWITPAWTLRAGSFQMPRQANGNVFDTDFTRARGDNVELTLSPIAGGPIVRVLGFRNVARMGRYRAALERAAATGTTPSIIADDSPGRVKYGAGINAEIPLADSGETGAFARAGWNDGRTESFAFDEVDRHVSAGLQVAGAAWHRRADRAGVALLAHALSRPHRAYLAAGGTGFLLGDGRLDYAPEQLVESYYRVQSGAKLEITPDIQVVRHPGYNRDRGPAVIATLRLNLRY